MCCITQAHVLGGVYEHAPLLLQGFHVYKVTEGLPAHQCGKIDVGDKLLSVSPSTFTIHDIVYHNRGYSMSHLPEILDHSVSQASRFKSFSCFSNVESQVIHLTSCHIQYSVYTITHVLFVHLVVVQYCKLLFHK